MAKAENKKDELFFVELGWQAQKGDLAIEWNFEENPILCNSPLKDFHNPLLFNQSIALLLDVARDEFCGTKSPFVLKEPIDSDPLEELDEDDLFDFGNYNSFMEVVSDGFLSSTNSSIEIHEQLFYFEIGAFGFCQYLANYIKNNYDDSDLEAEEFLKQLDKIADSKMESFSKYGNLDNASWYHKLKSLDIHSIQDLLKGLMTIEDENNLHLQQLLVSREELNQAIEAASDLQNALLPQFETLTNSFHEVFTYHKPKFKVGGDFYFYHKEANIKMVACCDCTGHGVRAAMLSVLLNKFLYQEIVVHKINDPEEVLKAINLNLFHFLNRNIDSEITPTENHEYGSGLRDSMDISICAINYNLNEIKICSTNESVLIINAENKIIEFDPKRISLGDFHYQKDLNLSTITIPLIEKTGIILASDGIIDQFGGPRNKKLGSKRYRTLIETILAINNYETTNLAFWINTFYHLWTDWSFTKELAEIAHIDRPDCDPIKTIHEIFVQMKGGSLHEFYNNIEQATKPRQEQIDDILIMGFRV